MVRDRAADGEPRASAIQSVERALQALAAFSVEQPELTVGEIARRLGVHKSTASRLLATLEAAGFVRQEERSGRYRLGLRLLAVAGVLLAQLDLRHIAQPVLHRLAEESQETANLAVWDPPDAVNVAQVASPQPIQYVGWVGRRTPAHASATGKALLAFQPAAVIEQVLRAPLQRYTARTITDAALLRAELEQVRRRGYAVAHEELQAGLTAVAAPIREADGRVQAVLSLSAPTYRTPPARQREHARLVVQAAAEVSRLLGYVDKPPGAPRRQAGANGTAPRLLAAGARDGG